MEGNTDWTASNLFSPSKARAQEAQAKDWALVDDWLRKVGSRLSFERNEQTLEALLQLANLNEGADEQSALIQQVEKTSLEHIRQRNASQKRTHQTVLHHLSDRGLESLEILAESCILLHSSSTTQTAESLSDLTIQHFETNEQLQRVSIQVDALRREQKRMSGLFEEISSPKFMAAVNLPEDTVEWTRSAKHLKAKVSEYNERLITFKAASTPSVSAEEISRHSQSLQDERKQLAELTARLVAFESLPPNPDAASKKVEGARSELRALMTQRDRLFEGLVEEHG